MLESLSETLLPIAKWSNDNQGVLTVFIYLITLAGGWASGIFFTLRRRPKFGIKIIPGPTFCCTYITGETHQGFDVHRTGIALYLSVANIGSAPSDLENISVGYHWHLKPFSVNWLKNTVGWFWLNQQTTALADFQATFGENTKVYPFLTQRNNLSPSKVETYLGVGRAAFGVAYFEQDDSWGGCFPYVHKQKTKLKVKIRDVFGHYHSATFRVPVVSIDEARKYNPAFGKSIAEVRGQRLPFDA